MVILVVILLLFKAVDYGRTTPPLSFTDFMSMVTKGEIDRVVIRGGEIRGYKKGAADSRLVTRVKRDPEMGGTGMNVNFVTLYRFKEA